MHGAAALGAGDVRFRRCVGAHALFALGIGQLVGKVRVERVQQAAPCLFAVGDLIEVSFHVGGKGVVQQFREVLYQAVGDQLADALGVKAPLLQGDVAAVLNGGNDRHVGGRTADAALFQFAYQAGFAVARRRLGEMLHGVGLRQLQRVPNGEVRQGLVVVSPGKHPGIAVELQNAAAYAQFKLAGGNRDGGGKVLGASHLRGHELSPDQVVEPSCIGLQTGELVDARQVRGADGFMRFLSGVLAGVDVGRTRQIGCAVGFADVLAHLRHRFGGDVGGVRAHVGDVAAFVQTLRQGHGLANAESEPRRGRLLQRGGNERGVRPRRCLAVFAVAHLEGLFVQASDGFFGRRFVVRPELLIVFLRHLETGRGFVATAQIRERLPVFHRIEGANLALAIHDQAHRHGLHATRRKPARHLCPQERRQFEAHHPVEEAPSLLGVDSVFVDSARVGECFLDGGFGDLVEYHASVAFRRPAEHLR